MVLIQQQYNSYAKQKQLEAVKRALPSKVESLVRTGSDIKLLAAKYIRMMGPLKQLVRTRTDINLQPSKLIQCYVI